MLVFFNAASFDNQGTSLHQSGQLLRGMMEAVEQLIAIGAEPSAIYRDGEVRDRQIAPGHTVKQATNALRQQIKREEEAQLQQQAAEGLPDLPPLALRFSQFLSYLTQSPLASEQFADQQFDCLLGDRDVSFEAVGYAAHFTRDVFEGTGSAATAVSLEGCPPFDAEQLTVTYMQEVLEEPRIVWNVCTSAQVAAVARTFEHNSKHDVAHTLSDGTEIAAMDVRGPAAQQLLNRAVRLPLPNEDRLFALHKGRVYVFPCHRPEERLYHGYPVEPTELRRRMADVCSALYRFFNWEELRP